MPKPFGVPVNVGVRPRRVLFFDECVLFLLSDTSLAHAPVANFKLYVHRARATYMRREVRARARAREDT